MPIKCGTGHIRSDCKHKAKCKRLSYYYCLTYCRERERRTCKFLKKRYNPKEYYEENREKILKQQKKYHKNNKKKIYKRKREYYRKNKVKVIKQVRDYQEKNYKIIGEKQKEYYQKNREKKLKKTIERQKIRYHKDAKFRFKKDIKNYSKVYYRGYPKICMKCENPDNSQIDIHHIKYTKNPKDWLMLCKPCHLDLHNSLKS